MSCVYFETVLNDFVSKYKIFFLFCPRHSDQGLIIVIVYYFKMWKNTTISRISNHMGPIYMETPYRLKYLKAYNRLQTIYIW